MILDRKLAGILSNFCADIAKAYFVVTFVAPPLSNSSWEFILMLTRGLVAVIVFILLSWRFSKLEEKGKDEHN